MVTDTIPVLDLFSGFTSSEIEAMRPVGSGGRKGLYWASLSSEEREAIFSNPDSMWGKSSIEKMTATKKKFWSEISLEYKEAFLARTMHSPEAKAASLRGRLAYYSSLPFEFKQTLSIKGLKTYLEFCEDGDREALRRKKLSDAGKAAWASKTKEEKEEWLLKSSHSPEARKKASNSGSSSISLGNKRYWASLSQEEYEDRIQGLKIGQLHRTSSSGSITWPEVFFGFWLEMFFMDTWKYNGTGVNLVNIGGRRPDFISKVSKSVIEVFGDYWHQYDDEESIVSFYKDLGYSCSIVWESDIFSEPTIFDSPEFLYSEISKLI